MIIARIIFAILIFISAVLESTILPFPLVCLLSCLLYVSFGGASSLAIIFLGGVLLDTLAIHHLGFTPLFLCLLFFVFVSLEKLFSLSESWVLAILIFMGVEVYRRLSGYPFLLGFEILLVFIMVGLIIFERRDKKGGPWFEEK